MTRLLVVLQKNEVCVCKIIQVQYFKIFASITMSDPMFELFVFFASRLPDFASGTPSTPQIMRLHYLLRVAGLDCNVAESDVAQDVARMITSIQDVQAVSELLRALPAHEPVAHAIVYYRRILQASIATALLNTRHVIHSAHHGLCDVLRDYMMQPVDYDMALARSYVNVLLNAYEYQRDVQEYVPN